MQLPVAMQMGAIQPWGIMEGKFQGAMPAKTPMGSLKRTVSKPLETFMTDSPFMMWGAPQANSTTSMTLRTSPLDSSQFLPFSRAQISVSSSRCWSSRVFMRKRTWTRADTGVSRQAG